MFARGLLSRPVFVVGGVVAGAATYHRPLNPILDRNQPEPDLLIPESKEAQKDNLVLEDFSEALNATGVWVSSVNLAQKRYEEFVKKLDPVDRTRWARVKAVAREAFASVHRFAKRHQTHLQVAVVRLQKTIDDQPGLPCFSLNQALGGIPLETRRAWVQEMTRRIEASLRAHRQFQAHILDKYKCRIKRSSADWNSLISAGSTMLAAVGVGMVLYSGLAEGTVLQSEELRSAFKAQVSGTLVKQLVSGVHAGLSWLWSPANPVAEKQVAQAKAHFERVKKGLSDTSCQLLEMDSNYEMAGHYRARADLVVVLRKIANEDCQKLIEICRQYQHL